MTQEQKDSLLEKIQSKKSQMEKLEQKIESKKSEISKVQKLLEDDDLKAQINPQMHDKNLNLDEMQELKETLSKKVQEAQQKIAEIDEQKSTMEKIIRENEQQLDKIQSDFMNEAASSIFELDKNANKAQFDLDLLPELNYEDVWPQAANVQEKFDEDATKKSGKIVRNGQKAAGLFGSNIRDILMYIDKTQGKLEEIDVFEIFKGKINTSKLDDFTSENKEKNFMEDKSFVGVFGTHREHIPLTTMYDEIKKENFSNKLQEMNKLMQKNAPFYSALKKVFTKKFKFAKKDIWQGAKEEGSLDVRNLWKLPTKQGDDFYEITRPKYVNKTAATILVDVSGSQSKEVTDYGDKLKELVLGLSVALDEVHIKHEVLGFHAPVCDEMRSENASSIYTRRSNRLETIIYKESAQKDKLGIMNIETQMSDNSDGESLRIAVKRLKAIRAKSHLLFLISDGKPFLCDTDMSVLDEDLRAALRKVVREKVQIIGLGYFNQLEHFLGERFCNVTAQEKLLSFIDKTTFIV